MVDRSQDILDYSRFEDIEAFVLDLVTPFAHRSVYPKAK